MHLYDTTLKPETYRARFSEEGETVLGYIQRVPTGLGPMWEAFDKEEGGGFRFLGFFFTEEEAWGTL